MKPEHELLDHFLAALRGEALECCSSDILIAFFLIMGIVSIGAICAPFLNQKPTSH